MTFLNLSQTISRCSPFRSWPTIGPTTLSSSRPLEPALGSCQFDMSSFSLVELFLVEFDTHNTVLLRFYARLLSPRRKVNQKYREPMYNIFQLPSKSGKPFSTVIYGVEHTTAIATGRVLGTINLSLSTRNY